MFFVIPDISILSRFLKRIYKGFVSSLLFNFQDTIALPFFRQLYYFITIHSDCQADFFDFTNLSFVRHLFWSFYQISTISLLPLLSVNIELYVFLTFAFIYGIVNISVTAYISFIHSLFLIEVIL